MDVNEPPDHQPGMEDTLRMLCNLGMDASSSSKFRREFKITGVIGDTSKDNHNYISLCSQVSDGKKKGYTDEDIVMSLRKAVPPGFTYLDSKAGITLEAMLSFIQNYIKI